MTTVAARGNLDNATDSGEPDLDECGSYQLRHCGSSGQFPGSKREYRCSNPVRCYRIVVRVGVRVPGGELDHPRRRNVTD